MVQDAIVSVGTGQRSGVRLGHTSKISAIFAALLVLASGAALRSPILSGLGISALLHRHDSLLWVGVGLMVAGVQSALHVAGQGPSEMALVDQARYNDPGMDRVVLVTGTATWNWEPFLREPPATAVEQVREFDVTAIVVKRSRNRPPDPRVLELVEDHGRRIDLDNVELYLFDGPLTLVDGQLIAP